MRLTRQPAVPLLLPENKKMYAFIACGKIFLKLSVIGLVMM